VEWDSNRRAPSRPVPSFSGVGVRVLKAANTSPTLWNLQLEYAAGAGPETVDRGLLTVRDGESGSFSIFLEDALAPEAARIPALGVSLRGEPAEAPRTEAQPSADRAAQVELAGSGASRNRGGASVVLGVPGLRQKFAVGAGGEVRLQNNALRTPGPDREARPWKWPDLVYQVGLGEHPRMGPEANVDAAWSLEEGWLPVVKHTWTRGAVAYAQRTLVGTLLGDPADLESTNGCDPTVLISRFELRNLTDTPQPIWLWTEMSRSHPVRLSWDGTLFLLHPSDGRTRTNVLPVRAHFQNFGVGTIDLAVLVPGGPGSFNPDLAETAVAREAIRYQTVLPPHGTAALEMVVPGVELLTPEQVQALKALRFEKLREVTVRFWQEQWAGGASWDLPDPTWQHALQAAHWQLLTALEVDPATGRLVAADAEGAVWRGREVAHVIEALERRGEHRLARLLIESSAAAALDPAGLSQAPARAPTNSPPRLSNPYVSFPALIDRACILEAAARHGRWAQDENWGGRFASELVLLSDLVLAGQGLRQELDRDKGPPVQPKFTVSREAGWLGEEAAQWRALDRAAQALEASKHAEAARLSKTASAWAEDLRAAVLEQAAIAPVVPISNGVYVARLPLRWGAGERRGLGSPRTPLHAPWDLFVDGLFPAEHPLAQRLWEEWRTRWPDALDATGALDFVLRRASAGETSPVLEQACRQASAPERLGSASPLEIAEMSRWRQEMIVADLGDRLELARGVPAAWWEPGRRWSVLHLPTRFGGLDVRSLAWADEQVTRLNLAWTAEGIGAPLRVWLPVTGNRPARQVMVNGRPALWTVGQAYLDLAAGPRLWDIQVKF